MLTFLALMSGTAAVLAIGGALAEYAAPRRDARRRNQAHRRGW